MGLGSNRLGLQRLLLLLLLLWDKNWELLLSVVVAVH